MRRWTPKCSRDILVSWKWSENLWWSDPAPHPNIKKPIALGKLGNIAVETFGVNWSKILLTKLAKIHKFSERNPKMYKICKISQGYILVAKLCSFNKFTILITLRRSSMQFVKNFIFSKFFSFVHYVVVKLVDFWTFQITVLCWTFLDLLFLFNNISWKKSYKFSGTTLYIYLG